MRLITILFIIVLVLLVYTNQSTFSKLIKTTPSDVDRYIIKNNTKLDSDKIVGTWKYPCSDVQGECISSTFVFDNDATGMWNNPILGVTSFKYMVSNNSILLSETEPCISNSFTGCDGNFSIGYKFYNDKKIILTIGGKKLLFERQSFW